MYFYELTNKVVDFGDPKYSLSCLINDQTEFSSSEKKKICALSTFEQKILFNYKLCRYCGELFTQKSKCKCKTFEKDEVSCELFDLVTYLIGLQKFPELEPEQKKLRLDDSTENLEDLDSDSTSMPVSYELGWRPAGRRARRARQIFHEILLAIVGRRV